SGYHRFKRLQLRALIGSKTRYELFHRRVNPVIEIQNLTVLPTKQFRHSRSARLNSYSATLPTRLRKRGTEQRSLLTLGSDHLRLRRRKTAATIAVANINIKVGSGVDLSPAQTSFMEMRNTKP
ncbi:hypothetical protein N9X53_09005, partial [Mariniblastus sp.]|nr:hypothetical protein [Mariniblastus sp.]